MPHWTRSPRALSLRTLLPEAEFVGADDICAGSCSTRAGQCRPGDLFAVLPNSCGGSRKLAALAARRGAVGLLAEFPVPGNTLPACYVPDVQSAYGRLCHALAGHPSQQIKVIGVAGGQGAANVSWLIAQTLGNAGRPTGLLGSIGHSDGCGWQAPLGPDPPPAAIAQALADMRDRGCSHAVVELSLRALKGGRLSGLEFDSVCLTTSPVGARGQRDLEAVDLLLDRLADRGLVVANADDASLTAPIQRRAGPVLTVGLSRGEIMATLVERHASEQTFLLCAGGDAQPVRTPLSCQDDAYHCLLAAGVALAYELPLEAVVAGLESVETIPGIRERIECGQPFGLFIDRARSPRDIARCLQALRTIARGRLLCVFGADGMTDASRRARFGRAVEAHADLAIVTADNPRHEDVDAIAQQILRGFRQPSRARVIADRGTAIRAALAEARPGDCVLLAGKANVQYQVIGEQWFAFDDRRVAVEWLCDDAPARSLDGAALRN